MNNKTLATASLFMLLAVAGCSHVPVSGPPPQSTAPTIPAPVGHVPSQRPQWFDSVETYKYHAAQHIMSNNSEHTFSGKLPPMLPAIVVLRITIDDTGRVTDVLVQRSPNDEASKAAVAAINRTRLLPQPLNLANGTDRTLEFSETFLFNHDNRFQLRTLAPIQTSE